MSWIDTHIDTLWAMQKEEREFHERSAQGHIDLPRAQEADLLCGFFTGFPSDSQYVTERVLRNWLNMAADTRNRLRRIYNFSDIEILLDERSNSSNKKDREIGIVLHFEGAAGIDSELNRLYIYYHSK